MKIQSMTDTEPLYDLSTFRQMDEEDPGALIKIISVFVATTPRVLEDLNKAYDNREMNSLAQLAHKLKATIDILSIKSLCTVIRQIEQIAITADNLNQLPELMDKLNTTMDAVFISIKKEIN